jgi:hypothetical protein
MINYFKKYWYNLKLKKGLKEFEREGVTSISSYSALRNMFILTGGKSNDTISKAISKKIGIYQDIDCNGVLGKLSSNEIGKMVDRMNKDGYYIFDVTLPEAIVNALYDYGRNIPCNYLNVETKDYSSEKVMANLDKPISPRYQFSNDDIINLPEVQALLFDQSLLAFAQKYLGVKPILDLVAFWWSFPFEGKGKSAAAQMYHFDMDRIKFMKFFFYLTDVDTNTGPHCYVKGSHRNLPESLSRDGRFLDQEIGDVYGNENLIEICGKKGSIIAVDTRGFHKGKELIEGKRLLFQIEFANSMFGQNYPPSVINFINKQTALIAEKYDYTYGQIFTPSNSLHTVSNLL